MPNYRQKALDKFRDLLEGAGLSVIVGAPDRALDPVGDPANGVEPDPFPVVVLRVASEEVAEEGLTLSGGFTVDVAITVSALSASSETELHAVLAAADDALNDEANYDGFEIDDPSTDGEIVVYSGTNTYITRVRR